MKTARFSDAQIMGILKQAEGGTPDAGQAGHPPHHILPPPLGDCLQSPAGQRDMIGICSVVKLD